MIPTIQDLFEARMAAFRTAEIEDDQITLDHLWNRRMDTACAAYAQIHGELPDNLEDPYALLAQEEAEREHALLSDPDRFEVIYDQNDFVIAREGERNQISFARVRI